MRRKLMGMGVEITDLSHKNGHFQLRRRTTPVERPNLVVDIAPKRRIILWVVL